MLKICEIYKLSFFEMEKVFNFHCIGSIEIYYSDSENLIVNLGISQKFGHYAEMRVGTSSDTEPGLRTHNISSKRHKLLKVLNLYLKNLFFKLPKFHMTLI